MQALVIRSQLPVAERRRGEKGRTDGPGRARDPFPNRVVLLLLLGRENAGPDPQQELEVALALSLPVQVPVPLVVLRRRQDELTVQLAPACWLLLLLVHYEYIY